MAKWEDAKTDAALAGRTAVRKAPMPGAPHIEIGVRLLTETQLDRCRLQAMQVCKDMRVVLELDSLFFERVLDRCILAEAIVDAETLDKEGGPEPFFADQKFVAELDCETVSQLSTIYREHQTDADPVGQALSEDELREELAILGKEQRARVFLSGLARSSLENFALTLAHTLREKSQTPSSSTGSS